MRSREKLLYGLRKAASGWEDDNARMLVNDGFQRGRAASTVFYHPKTHVRAVVHGDDFTFAATELRKMRSGMCEWYDVKVGSGNRDMRQIEILGQELEVDRGWARVRGERRTSPGTAGRVGISRCQWQPVDWNKQQQ